MNSRGSGSLHPPVPPVSGAATGLDRRTFNYIADHVGTGGDCMWIQAEIRYESYETRDGVTMRRTVLEILDIQPAGDKLSGSGRDGRTMSCESDQDGAWPPRHYFEWLGNQPPLESDYDPDWDT